MVLVSLLGFILRVEHALTFDGPKRGADYNVYVEGVRWTLEHRQAFNFSPSVNYQVRYQPPGWFVVAGVVLALTKSERAIASLAVLGWALRQYLLMKLLRQTVKNRWTQFVVLWLHSVLPLSVLIDGKVNSEGFHSTIFLVAAYALFRMERAARAQTRIGFRLAFAFGLIAGLCLLTKATSVILVVTAALVLGFRGFQLLREQGAHAAFARIFGPALVSVVVWTACVGWWCGPNLVKYHHPFPHPWDLEPATFHAGLEQPLFYRRPLGWALPVEWSSYLSFPVIQGPKHPIPNFWAYSVIGTWSDLYNRGFCRLKGGPMTDQVWGGNGGFMSGGGAIWSVSYRCIDNFSRLAWAGLPLSFFAAFGTLSSAWHGLRRCGATLVMPTLTLLGLFFVMLFALKYPLDDNAVLNPRYFMPIVAPMALCLGIWLDRLRPRSWQRAFVYSLTYAATFAVSVFLVYQRFGS